MKTYAIGDIHGSRDLLDRALAWIASDAGNAPCKVVFLGDYVDRGPDSAGVITKLMAGPENPLHTWITLKGNHEQLFYLSLEGHEEALRVWSANGGKATMESYQRMFPGNPTPVPDEHYNWMTELPCMHVDERFVFAHAAIDPDESVTGGKHTETFTLWGRMPDKDYVNCVALKGGRVFMHGHTPGNNPKYIPGVVLNIDTGAAMGGRLSVAAWDDGVEHPRIYQVGKYVDGVRYWKVDYRGVGSWTSTMVRTSMQEQIDAAVGIQED